MDQLIFASLSHTHYWYEVGMLKVPGVTYMYSSLSDPMRISPVSPIINVYLVEDFKGLL